MVKVILFIADLVLMIKLLTDREILNKNVLITKAANVFVVDTVNVIML
jgi:hypothetical protein